jgi:hypothetical protein
MANVSRPLLIVLAATAALLTVWVLALRPKPVAIENTPLSSTKVIPKASEASAVSDAANAKLQAAAAAADGSAPPAAAPPAAPTAVAPPAGTPSKAAAPAEKADRAAVDHANARIERAIAQRKVVVLLFWNSKASDDIATRGALRDLDLHGGKVVVRVIPIGDVARYTSVTRGVKIAQSPTTVIIGRKGATRVIAGLTEPHELSQAVGDALAGR